MKRLVAAFALLAAWLVPGVASAHPLGNFTVNHYARIEPAGDRVRIVYVLDMAEIPTFQEKPRIDPNPDAYTSQRAEEIRQNLYLTLNGAVTPLRLEQRSLSFPDGAGGLQTLRLEATYAADLRNVDPGSTIELVFRDNNDPTRVGWREMIARPGAVGTDIQQTSVPQEDTTNELRQYPEDLLNSPLIVREARLSFVPGAAAARPLQSLTGVGVLDKTRSAFADLANGAELTPGFILFAVGVAIVLGAAHALQPGHGKTVVAAYLVGSRGTARHALFLGGTVTATHTAGVYALGLVTLFLSQYILPERLYPILEIVSGLLVVGIGVWLFGQRLLVAIGFRRTPAHDHDHGHGHDHDHDHEHDQGDTHSHSHVGGHSHTGVGTAAHTEAKPQFHPEGNVLAHTEDHPHVANPTPAESHGHGDGHAHSHGGKTHSHAMPDRVSWKSLLALGVSGGLLPCPEALMVLLITIAAHRVLFGLLLIFSFSTGLAAVLVGFGLLLVYARGFFSRINLSNSLAARLLPVASALVIVIAGGVITAQALPQVL
jgi:ABC-type nickel/cobalt efflux system permease component RcnA